MNIVVEVAPPLIAAFDGRRRLELGVPPQSDVGDILDTLIKLYPKLSEHVLTDGKRKVQTGINVYWASKDRGELPRKLYLCASPSKRLVES